MKFYALKITDADNYTVVEHVANNSDDTVHVVEILDMPTTEWRKAHHLTSWVKANKPDWTIIEKEISFDKLFDLFK